MFDQNDTDMTPQLTKMKEAKVDFIIAYSLAPAGVQIAKSMQKIGLKVPWTGTWGLIAPNFLKLGGKELTDGVMAVTSYTVDHSENAKKFHALVEREYAAEGGDFWPVATAQTYDGTRLVLRGAGQGRARSRPLAGSRLSERRAPPDPRRGRRHRRLHAARDQDEAASVHP